MLDEEYSEIDDDHFDDHVEKEIQNCFSLENPKNFFVFAGAGSGKTRSLVNTMSYIEEKMGKWFRDSGKKIAVITYTNAAVDEISRRMQYNSIFAVSTIHSFLWELIKNYQSDIKEWLIESLSSSIEELNSKKNNARNEASARKTQDDIDKMKERLNKIKAENRFSYSPDGDNLGYNSLNHGEVVKMGCCFIQNESIMQKILISRFPIILIDESQDTKKELVDALNSVIVNHPAEFIVGMFGDAMQRIYFDGKENLAENLCGEWVKPVKKMNHRSAARIVQLANSIRGIEDKQEQKSRSDASPGTVRLFIADSSADKDNTEKEAARLMAQATGDLEWNDETKYKSLILEHSMAAVRFGFFELYAPLNDAKCFDTSLRNGTITELSFLSNVISPLVKAYKAGDEFEVSRIVRCNSLLLEENQLISQKDQISALMNVEKAVDSLMELWKGDKEPICLEILQSIKNTGLFVLDSRVDDILKAPLEDEPKKVSALREALKVPFSTLERYSEYVTDKTRFATHQGVKGLEFPRVMVIMDDAGAKGHFFSYEKLFGAKSLTKTDVENQNAHKDNSVSRTARLFYVTCTRARESLAIVAYSSNADSVKKNALLKGWFTQDEIIIV